MQHRDATVQGIRTLQLPSSMHEQKDYNDTTKDDPCKWRQLHGVPIFQAMATERSASGFSTPT